MLERRDEVHYVSLAELSARISLSPRTIRSLIKDPADPFPAIRVRNKLLFSVAEVDAYLEAHRVAVFDVANILDQIVDQKDEEHKR